jgi:hypothetical protein
MNILELDSYNLGDAVKFNTRLNPKIWASDETMLPEVRDRLLEIAQDFREFLGITDLQLKDITISGSNAAYTYTPHSDIDLHLVVDLPEADTSEVYRELFDAKKYQYNEQHNIKIGGYDVELYVQDANKPHHSQGIYSVARDEWTDVPKRRKPTVDDISTRSKYEDLSQRIDSAIASNDYDVMTAMTAKIRDMRQAGLDQHGEFGPENLAFKMLRTQGKIKELYDARNTAKDRMLSLDERRKAKKKKRVKYGFGGYWYPGTGYAGQDTPAAQDSGGGDGGGESIKEDAAPSDEEILKDFIKFCVAELKIKSMPTVKLRRDPQWSVVNRTFGRYINDAHLLEVAFGQRHIMDVLRTVAHELTHTHQHERETVPTDAGKTGSPYENEANARAGILMRDYGRLHPELFDAGKTEDLKEAIDQELSDSDKLYLRILETIKYRSQDFLNARGAGGGHSFTPSILAFLKQLQQLGKVNVVKFIQQSIAQANQEDRQTKGMSYGVLARALVQLADQEKEKTLANARREYNKQKQSVQQNVEEGASGYIPTKAQAKDPRFSMALTQDIRPGQLGKEANKLNLKTNKQGVPQIAKANGLFEKLSLELAQFKKSTIAESVEQQLDEVKMSPSALQQWANSDAAQGIRAGFEAELIFRDTNSGDDDNSDMEPDYDMDERCRSINQVVEFFQSDDYGYGLSERQANRLQENLDEQYMEWMDEQMYSSWRDERDELIKEAWLREKPMSERVHDYLVEGMEMDDREADRIQAVGDKAPKFDSSKAQAAYAEENPDYATYLEATEGAESILDEDVEQTIEKEDGFYDEVLDEFRNDFYVDDDSGFFDDVNLRYMSDVAESYDLGWPYLMGSGSNGGSREWDEIGDSLQSVVDMPVKVSSNYHSTTRKEGRWIVEPDSSLEPDDQEDFGLEIVSPPLPLEQALEKLQQVTDWANSPEGNAYTNSSTGLHMGVSVPFKGGDVDYLKLILFLGDEYVLQRFGREANTYTKSAMSKFRENIKGGRADPAGAMKLMQSNLIEFAYREIQKGVGEGKYTSAHIQKGYIEFRSAGGDWLAEENADPAVLQNTMLRYARAMSIAANPSEERREYAKKLYKLVAPEGDSQLALFSQFAAGELSAEQLKKRWAEKTIGTERKTNQRWKLYDRTTGEPVAGQEYNGYTEEEARAKAKGKISPGSSDRDFDSAYELRNIGQEQQWEIYSVDTGETLEIVTGRNKGEAADAVFDKYAAQKIGFNVRPYQDPATMTPRAKLAKRITQTKKPTDYNYDIIDRRTVDLKVVDQFYATDEKDASEAFDRWLKLKGLPQDEDAYGYRKGQPQQAVKDIEPDVAQNFAPDYSAFERNSDRIDAIRARSNQSVATTQAVDSTGELMWEIYDRQSGRAIEEIIAADLAEAQDEAEAWLESINAQQPELFGVRPKLAVSESIDPISGAGARAPVSAPKLKPQPPVKQIDPAVKIDIKKSQSDPYAQTYKKPIEENFADGKGPGRPGDSQRHGIPKGATIAQLEKAAKAPGRKGQLARWQLNMRRGKARAK